MYYLDEDEERAVERRDVSKAATAFAAKVALREAARRAAARAVPTGYLFFRAEFYSEVKAALEDFLEDGEKLKQRDIDKELAAQWKALSDVERAKWNAKAADIKAAINQNPTKAGMVTRKKKYRKRNKTKRNKRQKKTLH